MASARSARSPAAGSARRSASGRRSGSRRSAASSACSSSSPPRSRPCATCPRSPSSARLGFVITRVWRGWTATAEDADAYERLLGEEILPSFVGIDGFAGAEVLRRSDGDEVEFLVITRFESLDAVRAFAGPEYETPVIEPAARRLLSRIEERARHYEGVVELG